MQVIPALTDRVELPSETDLPADVAAPVPHLRHQVPAAGLDRIVANLDPALAAAACSRDAAPRQLPAAPGLSTGRAPELATMTDVVTNSGTSHRDHGSDLGDGGVSRIGKLNLSSLAGP